jgi:uncharacterized protein (UPF0262 family)
MNIPNPTLNTVQRITRLTLDDGHVIRRKPEIEQERQIALGDLLRQNTFILPDESSLSHYHVMISIKENRMIFEVEKDNSASHSQHEFIHHSFKKIIKLPVLPFRSIIRDYFMICENYFDAIKTSDPYKVEAIDMARRGIHNEGSELLQRLLHDQVTIDFDTARRFFTLMCVLHIR